MTNPSGKANHLTSRKLTRKQDRFIAEYLVDMNATQAAMRAGYSARNADKIGSQLLGKSRVARVIAGHQKRLAKKAGIDSESTIRSLAHIAFFDLRALYDDS